MVKKLERPLYKGWVVHPRHGGYDLASINRLKKEVFLATAFHAGKINAKKFFIEHPDGKKEWFKK